MESATVTETRPWGDLFAWVLLLPLSSLPNTLASWRALSPSLLHSTLNPRVDHVLLELLREQAVFLSPYLAMYQSHRFALKVIHARLAVVEQTSLS